MYTIENKLNIDASMLVLAMFLTRNYLEWIIKQLMNLAFVGYLTINEWGWVSYEELWKLLSVEGVTPSEISIIYHIIRKPNSIIQ